jgi:hypothetical protein
MRRLSLLVFCLFSVAAKTAEVLPKPYVGVWSTPDSVFIHGELYGGTAVYLDEDGSGVVESAPLPVRRCDGHECAPAIGVRFHANVENDPNAVIVTVSDYGPARSGVGFIYDPAGKVLISQFGEKGIRLTRISPKLPDFIKKVIHVPLISDTPEQRDVEHAPLPLP